MIYIVLVTLLIVSLAVLVGIWQYMVRQRAVRGPPWLFSSSPSSVLLVTAHPDDECMFFSPTILSLSRLRHKIYLLCLSTGNYYRIGNKREKELLQSCRILSLPKEHVFIVNDSVLQDDPTLHWSKETIARYIIEKVQEYSIHIVITFDDYGVSGHLNHKAIYHATKHVQLQAKPAMKVYTLRSLPIYRKYISILDIPISWCSQDLVFLLDWNQLHAGQRAMMAHWSQFVWFRALYIALSRYMVINTLTELLPESTKSA